MAAVLSFWILGELQIRRGAAEVPLRTGKLRILLATLLLRPNNLVSVDELVDRLWDERPPRGARTTVQTYVMRLRQALGDDTKHPDLILTRSGGYLLKISAEQLDLERFRSLVDQSSQLDLPAAAANLHEALSLWRGEALSGVPSDSLRRAEVPRLTEERLRVLDRRIELDLRLGRHADLVSELSALTASHPYREQFRGQLMLALFRSGRRADALESYRDLHDLLESELGVAPGAELQRLHEAILRSDPKLAPPAEPPARTLPRQLPAPPRWFVGRTAELAALDVDSAGAMGISVIAGAGGIGKTWLALRWAHRNADRFPDGQLFVDLQGFSPTATPLDPYSAVRGFLDALGVDPKSVPPDPHALPALYRSLLAGKRMLIVADNARSADQVIPLLPGGPTCGVLVTSRSRLTELLTRHAAHLLEIDVLSDEAARDMLRHRLGGARVDAEPDAVRDLVAGCAGFPLALGIVAGRAAAYPRFPLATLAGELRVAATRLRTLDDDNPAISLPAVLSWSHDMLTTEQARVFALLGLAPGPDIGLPATADLTGLTATAARTVLNALADLHLVQQHAPYRWRMHDLIRLFAVDQDLPRPEREAALRRLIDHYLHTAVAAARLHAPSRLPIELAEPVPGCRPQSLADEPAALAWLGAELPNLLAAQRFAAPEVAWRLAWSLHTFLFGRGNLQTLVEVWQVALAAAEDEGARILVLRFLGSAASAAGQYDGATEYLSQALNLAEHLGDRPAQAQIHETLALSWGRQRADQRTLAHATQALRLYQELDQPDRAGRALNSVGFTQALLGDYDQARANCTAALALSRRHRHRALEATTLDSLGFIAHHTGEHSRALHYYRRALTLYRKAGNTFDEADTLDRLGLAHHAAGDPAQARIAWHSALDLYRLQHREADIQRVRRQLDGLHLGQ